MTQAESHIPWSYGADRVTAAAVDPDRLYAYWEVTDRAIARARGALGPRGTDAALALRVYDVTGRLFDGSNAHHFFDHLVDRGDRQWFFTLARPTSTAVVEIGLRSPDGAFAKIARSRRVEFPRKQPASHDDAEWMTVRASGAIERVVPSRSAPQPARHEGPQPPPPEPFRPIPMWVLRDVTGHETRWEEQSWQTSWQWNDGAWIDGATMASWSAGPFEYPVEVEPPSSQTWHGGALVYRVGATTHVVHGRWHVVIRNLSAHRERAVVARWEIARSWRTSSGREARAQRWRAPIKVGGASELVSGGSERAWLSGSEVRLGGASEKYRLGASELRFGGASELRFAGASEVRLAGGSERRLAGASEWMLAGASERRLVGASEQRLGGASERRWG